jgi:hypothetical protein
MFRKTSPIRSPFLMLGAVAAILGNTAVLTAPNASAQSITAQTDMPSSTQGTRALGLHTVAALLNTASSEISGTPSSTLESTYQNKHQLGGPRPLHDRVLTSRHDEQLFRYHGKQTMAQR